MVTNGTRGNASFPLFVCYFVFNNLICRGKFWGKVRDRGSKEMDLQVFQLVGGLCSLITGGRIITGAIMHILKCVFM